jgi:hypothetical protein
MFKIMRRIKKTYVEIMGREVSLPDLEDEPEGKDFLAHTVHCIAYRENNKS